MADGALRESRAGSATLFELRSIIIGCYCLVKVSMAPAQGRVGLRRSGMEGRRSGSIILRGGADDAFTPK